MMAFAWEQLPLRAAALAAPGAAFLMLDEHAAFLAASVHLLKLAAAADAFPDAAAARHASHGSLPAGGLVVPVPVAAPVGLLVGAVGAVVADGDTAVSVGAMG